MKDQPLLRIALLCAAIVTGPLSSSAEKSQDWLRIGEFGRTKVAIPEISKERIAIHDRDNAGFVRLALRFEITLEPDGTVVTKTTEIRYFLSSSGIESNGDITIEATPSHETVSIDTAYVVASGGERIEIDRSTIQIIDVAQPGLYSGRKRAVIPLPALARGAVSVVQSTGRFDAQSWPLPWSNHVFVQSDAPVEHFEIRVDWRRAPEVPNWGARPTSLDCREQDRVLTCEGKEVARLRPDIDLRLAMDSISEIVVAKATTWSKIAADVRGLIEQRVAEGVPQGVAQRITREGTTDEEKFRQLFAFVADEIRYVGLERGTGAVVPRAPSTTYARRFGDCKDKVTLLIALAREIGLSPYAVLIGSNYLDTASLTVPSNSYFDHMVVCLDQADEKTLCADPTVGRTTPEESILFSAGRVALPLLANNAAPETMTSQRYGQSIEIESEIEIACNGAVHTETRRRLRSLSKIQLRGGYALSPPIDRDRFLATEDLRVRGAQQSAKISFTDPGEGQAPLVIESTHASPGQVAIDPGYEHFDNEFWLRNYALAARSDNGIYPIWNPGLEVRSSKHYRLCGKLQANFLGPTLEFEHELGSFQRTYQRTPSGVLVESTLRIPSGVFHPDRISRMNRFIDLSLDQSLVWFNTRAAR